MNGKRFIVALCVASIMLLGGIPAVLADEDLDDNGCAYEHVFKAKPRGGEVVPPVVTRAKGNFVAHINEDYTELRFNLVATTISNIVVAHIHLGAKGVNGFPVVTLYGPADPGGGRHNGNLAKGVITPADLQGQLAGKGLEALVREMVDGNAYVNIHTNDGIDGIDTGPGDYPNGEIRGQIELHGTIPPMMANLQVIHNAADPAAAVVDVYVNGDLLLDDFAFRTATPFVKVPGDMPLEIGVAPGTSTSAADVLKSFSVTLVGAETYVAIAGGVLGPGGFAANPDGRDTEFTLFLKEGARMTGGCAVMVDFFALHGATDAPTVDVIARDVATIVDDAAYGDMTGYVSLNAVRNILDVTPGGDNTTIVGTFEADLSGLGGKAAVVFASGFLDPVANQDGPAFGLFAALPTGDVVEFPPVTTARLQVIHNAADPAVEAVDIYLDGVLTIDDFSYLDATPFIDFPGNVEVAVGVAPDTSTSSADIIAAFPVTLMTGETYVAIANGVLTPDSFVVNPDGRDIGFTVFIKEGARESALDPGAVEFFVLHGSTDAPTVDVIARDVATLVDNAAYGDMTGYLSVPPDIYLLDITPGNDNATIVATFQADLSGLGGGAAVVFASGFLAPDMGRGDPPFGLFAALPNGTVVPFPAYRDKDEGVSSRTGTRIAELDQNRPNPFNPVTMISFALASENYVHLAVYDVMGREVATLVNGHRPAGEHQITFNAGRLDAGVYFYRLKAGDFSITRKMILIR
ncbi:MAG TPA: DUF4397 domain-containing protein [Patescibacteria group bacterium]|nr:DUF4397 domain-containing protein [Patescibacteria group bacterium]